MCINLISIDWNYLVQLRPNCSCLSDSPILANIPSKICSGNWVHCPCFRPSTSGTRRDRPTCANWPTRALDSASEVTDRSSLLASTEDPSPT